jgi:cell division protein FtsB
MLEFQQKKKLYQFLHSPLMLMALVVVLVVLAKASWGVYQKERLSAENLSRQNAELQKLSVRQNSLAQSIDYLKTDEGVEAEIRSKFRFARDGESIAVIIDNETATATKAVSVATSTESKGFFGRIFSWFAD